ncbi:MAG: formate/nitrite transporter family protein [Gracilimonas sp.]|nr:formate/nitrite transporter family protein [Gracilimonas sp.]
MKPTTEVLESIIEKANNELNRDYVGLSMSSFSAGLDIGFGPLLMGVFLTLSASGFGELTTEILLATAYSVGFILVILGRSELFTEHTTLAVMPVIDGQASVKQLLKLWGIVYVGNIVGGLAFTGLAVLLMPGLGVVAPEAFETIGLKLVTNPLHWLLIAGIFAGWLMGLLAWLVTAAQETISRIFIIWIITATIGILHLPHSIAGNVEVLFGLFTSTEIGFMDYFLFLVMATIGNILGGAIFVGLLKYGHVTRGAK